MNTETNLYSNLENEEFQTLETLALAFGGTEFSNIEITVPAILEAFGEELHEYDGKIASRGIGANLIGQLTKEQAQLKRGLHHLTFELSGDQKRDTYIMLDFYDVNNQTHCYYFQNKLS